MEFLSTPLAFIGSVSSHWATLVSSVLTFLVSLWFAYRGKTVGFGVLIFISVFAMLVAVYKAWEDEYLKNIGSVQVEFYIPSERDIMADKISEQVIIINTLNHPAILRSIDLGRVLSVDKSTNLQMRPSTFCKEMSISGENPASRSVPNQIFKLKNGDDTYFQYLKISHIDENNTLPLSINAGSAQILRITFQGDMIDPMKYNAVALCPSAVYLRVDNNPAAVLCEGTELSVVWGNKPPMRAGPNTLKVTILPVFDETPKCRSVFP
jgi:hypothetical protein